METIARLRLLCVLTVLVVLTGCANPTSIRQHTDFAERAKAIKTVAILPPHVEVVEIVFNGDDARLPQREEAMSTAVLSQAKDILQGKGYQVVELDYPALTAENPDLAFDMDQLAQSFNEVGKTMRDQYSTEEDYTRFKESVGERASKVAAPLGVDALLLVDYNGFEKSSGKIAQEMAATVALALLTGQVAMAPNSGSGVHLGLVEGGTGDVLWTNAAMLPGVSAVVVNNALTPIVGH